jgi:hypothetical protein
MSLFRSSNLLLLNDVLVDLLYRNHGRIILWLFSGKHALVSIIYLQLYYRLAVFRENHSSCFSAVIKLLVSLFLNYPYPPNRIFDMNIKLTRFERI